MCVLSHFLCSQAESFSSDSWQKKVTYILSTALLQFNQIFEFGQYKRTLCKQSISPHPVIHNFGDIPSIDWRFFVWLVLACHCAEHAGENEYGV